MDRERGDGDPDSLAAELNNAVIRTSAERSAAADESTPAPDRAPLVEWLAGVRRCDGSDLLLVAGAAPMIRAKGRLRRETRRPRQP